MAIIPDSLSYPQPIYVGGTFRSLLFPPSFFLLLQLLQYQHIEIVQHYHFFSVHMSLCEHQHLQKRNGFSASIPLDELAEAGIWLYLLSSLAGLRLPGIVVAGSDHGLCKRSAGPLC